MLKVDNQKLLIAIVVVTMLLFPVVAFTTGPLRIALGLLFVIFFPGYTLLSTIFPKQNDLSGIERPALSLGISVAIVPLIGLILNYTPWGIKLYPILISITLFIIITVAVGWYRQRRLPETDRLSFTFKASMPDWSGMSRLHKGLSAFLVVAVVAALGSLGYVAAMPKLGEKFTEFYILNVEGNAEDYPSWVILGEPVELIVGVANHEYQPTSYRVNITENGVEISQVNIGTLAHGEKYEQIVSFTPKVAGKSSKVDFSLYNDGADKPYFDEPLHLYIDVVTFYVLNAEGKTGDYPQEIKQGEPLKLTVGILNDQPEPTSYRVKISTGDIEYKEINTGTLAPQEIWQEKVSFIPWVQKEKQKIDFWLYKGDEAEPCLDTPVSINIGTVVYPRCTIATLPKGDRYTEFYVLDAHGRFYAYPWRVRLGETAEVIIGVANHEYAAASYRAEITMGGMPIEEIETGVLTHLDKWEKKVSFVPCMYGQQQKVEFWLYKDGSAEPYHEKPLYFHLDVVLP